MIAARRDFGYLAIIVYLQLLCIIYRDKGYYVQYDDSTKDNVISAIISESLIGKYQPDYRTIDDVISSLVACRLFSRDHFSAGFITSKRIQETYYKATTDRKNVSVDDNIWMLDVEQMSEISTRHSLLPKIINRLNNSVNRSNNSVNRSDNTQRKVKESKGKKRKVNGEESISYPLTMQTFTDMFGRCPDDTFTDNLVKLGKSDSDCVEAMNNAANKNPEKPESYMLAVIRSYRPKQTISEKMYIAQQEPIGELQDWEKEQLEEMMRYAEKRKNN